jgi:hypothetical protein
MNAERRGMREVFDSLSYYRTEILLVCGLDASGSEQRPLTGSCEDGKTRSYSTKDYEFVDQVKLRLNRQLN